MSLLLDARKKTQQAQSAQQDNPISIASESSVKPDTTEHPLPTEDQARNVGHNLFAAKSLLPFADSAIPNRNLLYALGGTIVLLAAGAVYLWFASSTNNTTPLRPISAPPATPASQIQPATETAPAIQSPPATAAGYPEKSQLAAIPAKNIPPAMPQPRNRSAQPLDSTPIRIEPQKTEPVDPLLRDAYSAYRNGKPDEARQLYLAMLDKDARNTDALLGLAAIAQQHDENQVAAQYFGRVLALDPRNATANAGISALNTDEGYSESRLKILLREQGNSAALHFALGNLYARQSRWGEAQQAYFSAFVLEPGNAEFAFNLAVSLDHLGQKKLAAQHYQHAMQLDSSRSAGFDHSQISRRAQDLTR